MPDRFLLVWPKLILALVGAGLCAFLVLFYGRVRVARFRDSFRCHRCGNCCRLEFISLTDDEVERLKRLGHRDFCEKNRKWGNVMKRVGEDCCFLENNSCRIYGDRPRVCREFPFGKFLGVTYCRNVGYCPGVRELGG